MVKTAVAYLRQSVSREKDARDGGSVSTAFQLAAVQRWCDVNDVTLLAHHQDVDESGASSTRKGLDAFVADVRRYRPDHAVMWDIKRLSRSLKLFLDVFDALQETKTDIVSCTEGTRHPAFVWKMLVLFAEEERERISVNITHGKREATKRGRHLGYAPLGYLRNGDGELVIDDETAWIIRWIYDRALAGQTATAICRAANERSLPTPGVVRRRRDPNARLGSTQWSRETIEATLRRPTYAGLVQSGEQSRSKHGKSVAPVIAEGNHPPLIPRSQWEAVQRFLDGNGRDSRPRGAWHWLKTRVVCAECGGLLYYIDAGRSDSDIRDRYWRCSRSYKKTFGRAMEERCPSPVNRIADRKLTGMVVDELSGALTRDVDAAWVARHLHQQRGAHAITAREQAERDIAECQAQLIAINDAVQFRIGDMADLAIRTQDINAQLKAANERLNALPVPTPVTEIEEAVERIRKARGILSRVASLNPEQWAIAAGEFGLVVTVDLERQDITLAYREPYETALSG